MAQYVTSELRSTNPNKFSAVDPNHIFIGEGENRKTLLQVLAQAGGSGISIVETEADLESLPKTEGLIAYVKNKETNYQYLPIEEGSDECSWTLLTANSKAPKIFSLNEKYPNGATIYYNDPENPLQLRFKYTSSTNGIHIFKVLKNGVVIYSKTINSKEFVYNLNEKEVGTFEYQFEVVDSLGAISEAITYKVVAGGLSLSSDFNNVIASNTFVSDSEDVEPSDIYASYKITTAYGMDNVTLTIKLTKDGTNVSGYPKTLTGTKITSTDHIGNPGVGNYVYTLSATCIVKDGDKVVDTIESNILSYKFSIVSDKQISFINNCTETTIDTNTNLKLPVVVNMYGDANTSFWMEITKYHGTTINQSNIVGETITQDIPRGTQNIYIGKLSCFNNEDSSVYTIHMKVWNKGRTIYSESTSKVTVNKAIYVPSSHYAENLVGYYTAAGHNNTDTNYRGVWKNEATNNPIGDIKLYNFNYNTNGWITDDSDEYLKFTGESYGVLDSSIFNNIHNNSRFSTGFTVDILYRTRCIGNLNARVLNTKSGSSSGDTLGLSIEYNSASFRSSSNVSVKLNENEWIKVTYVIPNTTKSSSTAINDNVALIYVNGVITSVTKLSKTDMFSDSNSKLTLNTFPDASGRYSSFGNCEIKTLRIYSVPLNSDQVLQNMLADISDIEKQSDKVNQNSKESVNNYMGILDITSIETEEYCTGDWATFSDEEKAKYNNSPAFYYLNIKNDKKTMINVNAEFTPKSTNGEILNSKKWIWQETTEGVKYGTKLGLQGTSSLAYPIKNYRFYMPGYKDKANASAIPDEVKTYAPFDGWIPESLFTLKCDYMDSSHMNNAGTAKAIDAAYKLLGLKNPAQASSSALANSYRNTIDGYPVLLRMDGNEIGTFMFNVDKSASTTFGFKEENPVIPAGNTKHIISYEITANSDISAGAFCAYDSSKNSPTVSNEFDYYNESFEVRYTDGDEETLVDNKDINGFKAIKELVEWVDLCANPDKDTTGNDDGLKGDARFKAEFEEHFNKDFTIFYYIQTMTFGMVDNLGKNCMLDTWDGKIWYPRFYDMDTMAGLNNTGEETILSDAEISHNDIETETRKKQFNTSKSQLWRLVSRVFASDIVKMYTTLRNSHYTMNGIKKYYFEPISDVICERLYNLNAGKKYILDGSTYLYCARGNRYHAFSRWMEERLSFMDTLLNRDNKDDKITLRFNKQAKYKVIINTYTPLYVRLSPSNDVYVTEFCNSDSTYKYEENGSTYSGKGTMFEFEIKTDKDQEVFIYSASKIMSISGLNTASPSSIDLSKAVKLTNFDINGSKNVTNLTLDTNTYLTSLDISNCPKLTGTLNLQNCQNLKYVYANNTPIAGITLPTGGSLKTLNLNNTKITSLTMQSLEFIESFDTGNCDSLSSISISKCGKLNNVSVAGNILNSFTLTRCDALTNLTIDSSPYLKSVAISTCNSLDTLRITKCSSLSTINVSTLYALKSLVINGSSNVKTITYPKYLNEEEAKKGSLGKLWNVLEIFGAEDCAIENFLFGDADTVTDSNKGILDFSKLGTFRNVYIRRCNNITEIKNLTIVPKVISGDAIDYTSFRGCIKLTKISGNFTLPNNAGSLFAECTNLSDISGLTLDMSNVTTISSIIAKTKLGMSALTKILNSCSSALTTANNICIDCKNLTGTLSASIFATTPNITTLQNAFLRSGIGKISEGLFGNFVQLSNCINVFRGCSSLTSVPSNLMKMASYPDVMNMAGMFYGDSNLKVYNNEDECGVEEFIKFIPAPVYSISGTFAGTNVSVSSFDSIFDNLTNITDISALFFNCPNLYCNSTNVSSKEKIQLPDGLFSKCAKLENAQMVFANAGMYNVSLPDKLFTDGTNNASKLINAGGLFYNSGIEGVVKNDLFKGSAITQLGKGSIMLNSDINVNVTSGGVFENTNVTGVYSNFLDNIPSVATIQSVFKDCKSLSDIYIYNSSSNNYSKIVADQAVNSFLKNTTKLQNANSMFNGCTQINGVVDANFFKNCTNLQYASYVFYKTTVSSVPSNLFANNTNLVEANYIFANTNIQIIPSIFAGLTKLTSVNSAFSNCLSLNSSSKIPDGMFSGCIELNSVKSLFENCTSLNGTIPSNMFSGCRKLVNVSNLFGGCESLTGFIDAEFLAESSLIVNMSYMFYNCKKLTTSLLTADILDNKPKLTDINNIFRACSGIKGIIPAKFLASSISIKNASYAFRNSGISGFEFVTDSNGETYFLKTAASNLTDMYDTFYGCNLNPTNNKTNIPKYWETPFNVSSFQGCFYGCNRDSDINSNWTRYTA